MYADDTVIFGTDETSFQKNLDVFYEYAKMWKLNVNYDNAKVLIFGTRFGDHFSFKMGESKISIGMKFKYLVVAYTNRWSFCKARKNNYDQKK